MEPAKILFFLLTFALAASLDVCKVANTDIYMNIASERFMICPAGSSYLSYEWMIVSKDYWEVVRSHPPCGSNKNVEWLVVYDGTIETYNGMFNSMNLKAIDLKYAQTGAVLHAKTFEGAEHSLEYLELHSLSFQRFERYAFSGLSKLKVLSITSNRQLSQLGWGSGSLLGLRNLEYLKMHNNELETLPVGEFNNQILPSLRYLNVGGNPLKTLSPLTFENLDLPDGLEVANTKLRNIPAFALRNVKTSRVSFAGTVSLETIDEFAFDNVTIDGMLDRDGELHLYYANFGARLPERFLGLKAKIINMPNAGITTISPKMFTNDLDVRFKLYDNPWHCDCNLVFLRNFEERILDDAWRQHGCSTPESQAGKSVYSFNVTC